MKELKCYYVKFQIANTPEEWNAFNGPYDYYANAIAERNRLFKADEHVSACWITHGDGDVIRGRILSRVVIAKPAELRA